jgi:hypothetical protein
MGNQDEQQRPDDYRAEDRRDPEAAEADNGVAHGDHVTAQIQRKQVPAGRPDAGLKRAGSIDGSMRAIVDRIAFRYAAETLSTKA